MVRRVRAAFDDSIDKCGGQSTNVAANRQMWSKSHRTRAARSRKCRSTSAWCRARRLPSSTRGCEPSPQTPFLSLPVPLPAMMRGCSTNWSGPICRHRTSEAPCLTDFSTSGAPGLRRRLSDPRVGARRLHAARRPRDLSGASPLVFVRTMRCVESAAPAVQLKTKMTPLSDAPNPPTPCAPSGV